ncbi:hypothetical protein SEA_HONK_22 [Microbacterium phage Honk]|uniref:Uncharacterized protein n=1 Tax=Microbacterium phage Honk TaxID=2836095 RepID=A0A8F3IMS4_9CAUD|nr:hypothetical protein SEA_HONK_22 [Microbacterium phage Honk]
MTNTNRIPTAVTIPEGYEVRIIDNYAGDHNAPVVPGRYELTPAYRFERAEWTASGQNERHFKEATASLTIREPERTVATVLYFGKALATKVEPAHEATKTLRIEAWHLPHLDRFFPTLTFHFED